VFDSEQSLPHARQAAPGEQRPIRLGELQVPGDEQSAELLAPVGGAIGDSRVRLDDRDGVLGQRPQQGVLPQHETVRRLLDREHPATDLDEPHQVPGDAARDVHDQVLGPVGERHVEGQPDQLGVRAHRGEGVVAHADQGRGRRSPRCATPAARRAIPSASRMARRASCTDYQGSRFYLVEL
jgi:hypothetical protein